MRLKVILTAIGTILLSIAYLCLGSIVLGPAEVLNAIFKNHGVYSMIVLDVRLPRLLGCFLVGSALSASGLILQTLFRNPLVEPYTLGVSSGALFFVGLGIVLGFSLFRIGPSPLFSLSNAVIGSTLTLMVLTAVAPRLTTMQLLIVGVSIAFLYSAGIEVLTSIAELEKLPFLYLSMLGTLSGSSWERVIPCIPLTFLCLIVIWALSKRLNALILGETYAITMGISVRAIRALGVFLAGLLTSISTVIAGVVGFIGLVTPHIARLLYKTSRIDVLLPHVVLIGSLLTLASDLIARLALLPHELPLTAVTSVFGVPMLIHLVLRRGRDYAV